jgi:tetratricopeptide (TPR) repeat protein
VGREKGNHRNRQPPLPWGAPAQNRSTFLRPQKGWLWLQISNWIALGARVAGYGNAKGPQFADPLELWGEALMLKNRSHLALAKLEEANKYAPNWGRLHLEWGKALFYTGRRDEANKQIANASHLELSASDRAALHSWVKQHG